MALLTGPAIRLAISKKEIVIEPYDPSLLGTNSYDCHLGDGLSTYDRDGRLNLMARVGETSKMIHNIIDSHNPPKLVQYPLTEIRDPSGKVRLGWVLEPGRLYIGHTIEYTETWGYVPRIDGRSTCGRLGVFGHITAGQGDNGFCGTWTLEITVVEAVVIYPGQRLFQLRYDTQEGEPSLYGETNNTSGGYQGQREPRGAKKFHG